MKLTQFSGFFNPPRTESENKKDQGGHQFTEAQTQGLEQTANPLYYLYHSMIQMAIPESQTIPMNALKSQPLQLGEKIMSALQVEDATITDIIKVIQDSSLSKEEKIAQIKQIVQNNGINPFIDLLDNLLQVNAELELCLMAEYLYAGYSIKTNDTDKNILPSKDKIIAWKTLILNVGKEEMGHYMTVQNIRKRLNYKPHFYRTDLLEVSNLFPYAKKLEPLSLKSLANYICAEAPPEFPNGNDHTSTEDITLYNDILKKAGYESEYELIKVSQLFNVMIFILENFITELEIEDINNDSKEQTKADRIGQQAKTDQWNRGYTDNERKVRINGAEKSFHTPKMIVKQLATKWDCVEALKEIAEQGENPTTDYKNTHFGHFLEIYKQLANFDNIGFSTFVKPLVTLKDDESLIKNNTYAKHFSELFNIRYTLLLKWIEESFELRANYLNPSESQVGKIVGLSFGEMYNIKALSEIITKIKVGDDKFAAPSFISYTNLTTIECLLKTKEIIKEIKTDSIDTAFDIESDKEAIFDFLNNIVHQDQEITMNQ